MFTVPSRNAIPRGGGGGHLTEVLVGVCRGGLQTLTLFKRKSVHFDTLFKKRDLLFCLRSTVFLSALFFFSHTESIFFKINNIIVIRFKKLLVPKCRIQGFQSIKTPCSRRYIVKLYILSNPIQTGGEGRRTLPARTLDV